MQAHQELMLQLLHHNFPKQGNIYEYCANEILRYDRKLKIQRKRELAHRLKIREGLAAIGKGIGTGGPGVKASKMVE